MPTDEQLVAAAMAEAAQVIDRTLVAGATGNPIYRVLPGDARQPVSSDLADQILRVTGRSVRATPDSDFTGPPNLARCRVVLRRWALGVIVAQGGSA